MERKINIFYSKTINTGNCESIKVGGGFSRELGEDENRLKEIKKDFTKLRKIIDNMIGDCKW